MSALKQSAAEQNEIALKQIKAKSAKGLGDAINLQQIEQWIGESAARLGRASHEGFHRVAAEEAKLLGRLTMVRADIADQLNEPLWAVSEMTDALEESAKAKRRVRRLDINDKADRIIARIARYSMNDMQIAAACAAENITHADVIIRQSELADEAADEAAAVAETVADFARLILQESKERLYEEMGR